MSLDKDYIRVFNEIIKVGSKTVGSEDVLQVSKNAAALSILNSAMLLVDKDLTKSRRLVNLSQSIVK